MIIMTVQVISLYTHEMVLTMLWGYKEKRNPLQIENIYLHK
jgi:hypothetical protein